MLIIRRAQEVALLKPRRAEYVRAMRVLLREMYPHTLVGVPDDELLARIDSGFGVAAHHGFETDDEVGMFVELTALLGEGFESSDWAAPILFSTGPHRAASLHTAGLLTIDLDE